MNEKKRFFPIPFQEVYSDITKRKAEGTLHVPIFEVVPVMPRNDNLSVFEEGQSFSGIEQTANAKACVTIVASAHVPPTVPSQEFITASQQVFGERSTLPANAKDIAMLPPQTIVWWALNSQGSGSEKSDFQEIARMDKQTQKDFCVLIAHQVYKAAQLIELVKGRSIAWGSWGNGSLEERSVSGMSRGIPTNKIGHCHVIHIDEAKQLLIPQAREHIARDEVNFAQPWTTVIKERFGNEIGIILENAINIQKETYIPEVRIARLDLANPTIASLRNSFEVQFRTQTTLQNSMEVMIIIAKTLEDLYQKTVSAHTAYYLNSGNTESQAAISLQLQQDLREQGFAQEKAEELARFTFAIRPTLIQLERWRDSGEHTTDALYERYVRIANRLKRGKSQASYLREVIEDTFKPLEEVKEIERTFPVHASAFYLFDDFTVGQEALLLSSFRVFPEIASSIAAPERILGGIEKRPLAA